MSTKDLCTIGFVDQILDAGVSVLKLEGRGRSADYVKTVTRTYREAVDAYKEGTYTEEKIAAWTKQLEAVYNRGFWHGGYYLGKQLGEWSGEYGSKATKEKHYVGRGNKYFEKNGIGEFTVETGEISIGDEIVIIGPTTGAMELTVASIFVNDQPVQKASKGDICTIPVPDRIRKSDTVFVVRDR